MLALRTTETISREAIAAARAGERVAIFADTLEAAQAFAGQAFELVHSEDRAHVRRQIGDASVSFPEGGKVNFLSTGHSSRGRSLDRAYVPAAIAHVDAAAIAPCLATSRNPQMIGYFPE